MDKFTQVLDILKKAAGEGSRGGHIIGHTRAGNPIYDSSSHEGHANFKGQDHRDAMNQHHEIWSKTQEKIAAIREQKPNWNPPKEVHDFLKHHYTQMQMHQSQMGRKEDREAKNKKTVGDAQSAKPEAPGKKFEPLKYGHMSKSEEIIPFFAAVIVVDSKKKNFLLGKRLDDGQWTAPTGGAVLGEFPKKTAIREVFEEAAIALDESQLQELPMGYAQGKPVHCYLAILTPEQMKCVSSDNDPDEEVKTWKWIPIMGKLPEPMDENRSATMLNAKMHLAGIMMKSYENLDAMEGMTSINTAEFKEENEESHPMKARIEELMKDYESGDEPKRLMLDKEHILHLVKVDEGIFSGFVKRTNEDGLEETAVTLDKMPLPSIIQYLKAKEVLKDEKPHVEVEKEDSNLRQVIEQLAGMTVYGDVNITIKKAKALPVGTVRQWGVYKYVKHADGWVVIGGEHHGKLMGNFKADPTHGDFARHHENSSPQQDEPKGSETPKKVDAGSSPKEEPKTEAKPKEEAPEKDSKETLKEEAKAGLELGKKAHADGKKAVPAQDPELMKLLSNRDRTRTSIHILEAWNRGWHSANSEANPIPPKEEPKKAEPKKEEAKPKEKTADEKIAENNKRIEELTRKLKDIEEASKKAEEAKKKAEEASKKKEEESKSDESGLTPEQQKYREDNAVKVSRAEHYKAHTMSLKDYIAHGKKRQAEDMYASNARPGPNGEPISDERKAQVKSSIDAYMKRKDRTITKDLKQQHKTYTEIAVNAGLPDVSKEALKEYPGLGGTDLPEGMDMELNKKTNLIKAVDLGTSSAKIKKQFTEHVNNCNKVIDAMGITFKTPLKFEAKGLSSLGKRVRGTYQNATKTIALKDMSAASKTLMHEIGHALDYAMQYMGHNGRHSEQMMKLRSLKEEERGELHKLYGELHEIVTQSDYYQHVDSRSFKDYLVTPTEVFARAFEVYSLQKAEELKLPQDFMDTFVPDVFKTKDPDVVRLQKELEALNKLPYEEASKPEINQKRLELRKEYQSKIEKTEGGWTTVSEDRQKEYKQKVSDIMSKILAKDEIRKAIQQMELADILRKSENFQKAQGLPTGTVRVWHGQKFIKQGDGHWVPMPNGQSQGQAEPQAAQAPRTQPEAQHPDSSPKEQAKTEPKEVAQPSESKKEEAGPLDHFKPQKGLGGHTEISSKDLDETLKNGKYSIISAGRNPANAEDRGLTDDQVKERYKRLEQDLKDKGYKYTKVKGHYGGEEESFLVQHADPKEMNELGKKYNQDSVIHSDKGENKLHFTTGENADKHHKGKGYEEVPDAKDYYSVINTSDGQQKKFSLNLDFGKHHGADE
jgi:ADP-ribose pyrophosphatase YjhB (NUDIX family)